MRFSAILPMLMLTACASAPPFIDVSGSVYKPSTEATSARKTISNVEIRSTADDGKVVSTGLGADSIFPIKPATTTRQTVEADLRNFFSEVLVIDKSSSRTLSITIAKADSYWIWGGAAKVPILGIAFIDADTEFGMNVRVLVELEEDRKVVSSYLFDEKVTIQGKVSTGEAIQSSYKRLVAEYRKRLFGELESRFVRRYL